MKKVLLLTFLCIGSLLTSCSKDDDNGGQDPFIGSWGLIASSTTANEQTTQDEMTDCEKRSTVTVNADGTYESISYSFFNEECELSDNTPGRWENLGDGVYRFTWNDGTVSEGAIVFTNDTFSISENDGGVTFASTYQKK